MELGIGGKVAVVTGASSGLGLGCAAALAAEGVRVAMVSRSRERLERAVDSVEGGIVVPADVTDRRQLDGAIDTVEGALGPIDILIANAGGPPPGTFATTAMDAYQAALDLNLLPAIRMCRRLVPGMQERGWGRVVAITSTAVREPIGNLILSNTSRSGLTAFLKTVATEVAPDGVTVNSLQPGLHLTDRLTTVYEDPDRLAETVPMRSLGDPADFGRVAAFLCSTSARFITGSAIAVDGGSLRGLV